MKTLPYFLIVSVFAIMVTLGFMGVFKPKPKPLRWETNNEPVDVAVGGWSNYVGRVAVRSRRTNDDIEQVIADMEQLTAKLEARANASRQRVHEAAYVIALAGYCAATNGVPFQNITGAVARVVEALLEK